MKKLIVIAAVACFSSLYAGVCTWTGNARDGKWSSPGNWSAVPGTSDEAEFDPGDSSLEVTLDSAGLTTVSIVRVKSGKVTLKAAEGASLRTAGTTTSGLDVAAGAELVVAVPLDLAARFNKSGAGTVRFQSTLKNTDSGSSYFFDGKVFLEGDANLDFNGTLGLGLGSGAHASVVLNDNARLRVNNTLSTGYNDNKSASADLVVDGAGATLSVWKLHLGSNSSSVDPTVVHNMTVSNGTASITTLLVGKTASASYVQEGGTVSVSTFTILDDPTLSASFALKGGQFDYNIAGAAIPEYQYADFSLQGGTFAASKGLTVNAALALPGAVAFEVPAEKTIVFEKSPVLFSDSVFTKKGAGKLLIKNDLTARGALSVEAGEVCFGVGVTVRNPAGVYTPYPVSVATGATLRMDAVTTRLSLPLDLTLDGIVAMSEGENGYTCKSVLVAHKLTVGGVAKGKGRLAPGDNLTGGAACSIVIPYVWNGSAGDNDWNTAANWDGNAVPAVNGATVVDISRATAPIRLDTEAKFGCLVSMPGPGQVRTIEGDGMVNLRVYFSYACAAYVEEGSELVLGVDLEKDSGNYLTFLGGGTIRAKKRYPTNNGNVPPFVLDATVVLAGTCKPDTDLYLGALSHRQEGRGVVRIEDGADVKFKNIFLSADKIGEFPVKEFRQTGGTMAGPNIYLTHYDNADNALDPFAYILDGGTLSSDYINLGQHVTSAFANIFPGGDFIMNGGTANLFDLKSYRNQNYFRLNGGDFYCRSFSQGDPPVRGAGRTDKNETAYLLGGITLYPRTTGGGFTSKANVTLSGRGGDTVVDCGTSFAQFNDGYVLDGIGGILKRGSGALTFYGETKFTGTLTVAGGTATFDSTSKLNGVSRFAVTDAAARIAVNGTVTKSPDVIELADASCLDLASGKTLTVKRLVVGGTDYADGDYTFGSGSVTVNRTATGIWIGANGASWSTGSNWASGSAPAAGAAVDFSASALAADASIVLDAPVSLSALGYSRFGSAGKLTLSGTGTLTLSADGVVNVADGDMLVLAAPLKVGGSVRKAGGGKLVLAGGISADGIGNIRAEAGEVVIASAVDGVLFSSAGGALTFGDGAVVSGEVIVRDAGSYAETTDVELGSGKIIASGALVGASVGLVLNGETAFGQPTAADSTEIATTLRGSGTLCQDGPGTLVLATDVSCADLSLADGTLVIGSDAAAAMAGTQTLSVSNPKESSLALDYAGEASILKLVVNGREKKPGLYDENLQRVTGGDVDPAKGYLRVLTGNPPGLSVLIR